MKYGSLLTTFKFSWDQVSISFWNRYPNPHSSHVLSEDTLSRHVSSGKLYSKRFLTKTNSLPRWGEMFVMGPKHVCIVEDSIVDPVTKTLTTYTRNIGLTRVMVIEEKCVYRPCSESPADKTVCERQVWVDSSIYGFARALQAFGLERFKKNAAKATKGFEYILQRMHAPEIPNEVPDIHKMQLKADKIKQTAQKAKDIAKAKAVATGLTGVTSG